MKLKDHINVLKVNVHIIFLYAFIFTTIFAHPHSNSELITHSHPPNESDLNNDLDEFDDLNLRSSNTSNNTYSKQNKNKKKLILFDENIYFLDDDFDFGNDEYELQKLEINTDDLEIANEYEDFLNTFFKEAALIGNKTSSSKAYNNESFEAEKHHLNRKIRNLEKQLQSALKGNGRVNNLESEKLLLNQKIEYLEKQLQSAMHNLEKNVTDNNPSTISKSEPLDKSNVLPSGQTYNTTDPSRKLGFGFSTIMGTTIPNGEVTKVNFNEGPNFGMRLDTPYLFNLARMEAKLGVEIYISSMDASSANDNNNDYYLTNIVGNLSIFPFNRSNNKHLSSIEIKYGLGLTSAAIGRDKETILSIPVDIIYYLPMDLLGFHIGINLHSQYTMGYPGRNGNTTFLNVNLLIKTPLQF